MANSPSFWPILEQLRSSLVIDLSHPFGPRSPHAAHLTALHLAETQSHHSGGFLEQRFTFDGSWGTHIDAPAHMQPDQPTLDQIDPHDMVLPLVVIDVHDRVFWNADYMLSVADVAAWEAEYGRLPPRAFVVMRTDWGKRWPDDHAFSNTDENGISHWPGWEASTLQFLIEKRGIAAIGHETISTDGGMKTVAGETEAQRILSEYACFQVELLAHLDKVPSYGAVAIICFPNVENGASFPVRVLALAPQAG